MHINHSTSNNNSEGVMIYEKGCRRGYSDSGSGYSRIYGLVQNETARKEGAEK